MPALNYSFEFVDALTLEVRTVPRVILCSSWADLQPLGELKSRSVAWAGVCIQRYFQNRGKNPNRLLDLENYSAKWVLLMLYGSTYEITAFILLNFIYMHNTKLMIAGIVVSCAFSAGILPSEFTSSNAIRKHKHTCSNRLLFPCNSLKSSN